MESFVDRIFWPVVLLFSSTFMIVYMFVQSRPSETISLDNPNTALAARVLALPLPDGSKGTLYDQMTKRDVAEVVRVVRAHPDQVLVQPAQHGQYVAGTYVSVDRGPAAIPYRVRITRGVDTEPPVFEVSVNVDQTAVGADFAAHEVQASVLAALVKYDQAPANEVRKRHIAASWQ